MLQVEVATVIFCFTCTGMIYLGPGCLGWDIFFRGYNAVQTEINGPYYVGNALCAGMCTLWPESSNGSWSDPLRSEKQSDRTWGAGAWCAKAYLSLPNLLLTKG